MKPDRTVYYMSHLLLVSLFMELNLPVFFTGGNRSLLFWTPAQRERGMLVAWLEGIFFYPFLLYLCGLIEGQKISFFFPTGHAASFIYFFFLPQQRKSHTFGTLTHHWLLENVEPLFTADSWVLNSLPLLLLYQ